MNQDRPLCSELDPKWGDRDHAEEDLPYRPEIQGLRAIAILLVVLAHANVSAFSCGFVGVDVFCTFWLSNYWSFDS